MAPTDMPKWMGETYETSTLHKELQATEGSWEQEKWSSPGKSTPIVFQCQVINPESMHIKYVYANISMYMYMYVYAHISIVSEKKYHEFEGKLEGYI
jgi:hypothetical protein